MTWFRVDDQFGDHPKVEESSLAAIGLWAILGAWCGRHNTDGWIPYKVALRKARDDESLVQELIRVRLLDKGKGKARDQVRIHDFLDKNLSRTEVESDRARRKEMRDPAVKRAVRERDGDNCRYCSLEVSWNDKRSPYGGTYDHVIPELAGGPENLVVACRGCNSAKQRRTPAQAGMVLLPVPGPESRLKSVPNPNQDPPTFGRPSPTTEHRDGTGRDGKIKGLAGPGVAGSARAVAGDGAGPDGGEDVAVDWPGRAPAEGGLARPPERVVAGSCLVHHVDLPCRVCAEGESGAVAL